MGAKDQVSHAKVAKICCKERTLQKDEQLIIKWGDPNNKKQKKTNERWPCLELDTRDSRTCLDLTDGNIQIKTKKTGVGDQTKEPPKESQPYGEECIVNPCHNQLIVTSYLPKKVEKALSSDVFYTQPNDNETSLSIEDRKFIDITQKRLIKNELSNWEMPLPFRNENVKMPNNRKQALNRLNSLRKTLNRKPQMKHDYVEFMEKIISKGHASHISNNEDKPEDVQV